MEEKKKPRKPRTPRRKPPKVKDVPNELRDLEERLDALIASAPASYAVLPETMATPTPTPPPPAPAPRTTPHEDDVDDFGYDPSYDARVRPVFEFLYNRYFRVECRGMANIPDEGRCMLVANHSGTIPFDGPMLKMAVLDAHPAKRPLRWLAEDFVFHFPFLGSFESRIGAVRACQENAERLLRQETLLAVFPEGVKGIGKLYKERYKLQRFGRGGFVRLAMRTHTPIVPVAIVGGEETNPMLAKLEALAKPLGVPYVPITPTFPLLGPLGLLPAPTKWKIVIGEPVALHDGAESEADEMLVARIAERVRSAIQQMLDGTVRERKSVLFG
jgi:1-acyl-sn-glycerol-3-phosphate acyltransferase